MPPERPREVLSLLHDRGIEHIVVGGMAGVMLGASVVTFDVDVVHRRTAENIDRILAFCDEVNAFSRLDLMNRKLRPSRGALEGTGHVNLATDYGHLDFLCELELGQGYEELLVDTEEIRDGERSFRVLSLPRLIEVKSKVGRPKDRVAVSVLLALLDEREKAK